VIRTNLIDDLTFVPLPPWWQSPWVLAGLVAGVLVLGLGAWWLARWLKSRPVPPPPAVPLPDLTPEFLQRLAELRARRSRLSAYDLAIACSDVLREFLEWRFRVAVTAQTTREFLETAAQRAELAGPPRDALGKYLGFCDLVKFARHGASEGEQANLLDAAEQFVRQSSGSAALRAAGQSEETNSRGSESRAPVEP